MKKLALLLFFACSIAVAQGTISKKLGDFTTLKVFNGLTVELQKSKESKIEISGSKSDHVVVKNSNGVLKIRLQFPEGFTTEDLRIVLFYNENIDVLDAYLTVKAVSGGIIYLSGVTENQNIEATTGGIYEGYNLKCKQVIVMAASGARTEVNASEILDAKVRFGGTIYYRGNPEVLKTKKIIGGVIKDKN
jgi:hypothetical protein